MTISTDLTFITNEPGNTLQARFEALLTRDTHDFDCLVGYFYLSGFYRLYLSLEKVEKIRILVGLQTDLKTYDLIQQANDQSTLPFESHAAVMEQVPLSRLERTGAGRRHG